MEAPRAHKYLFVGGPADCRGIVVPEDAMEWELKLLPNLATAALNIPYSEADLVSVIYQRQRFALGAAAYADVFAPKGTPLTETMLALVQNYKWKQNRG